MSYSDIIDSSISLADSGVSRANFTVPLFVSTNTVLTGRTKLYSGSSALADMLTDGFVTTDAAYKQASAAMAQSPRINKFKIGRAAVAESVTDAFNAILAEDPDFFGFCFDDRDAADIRSLAALAETNRRLYLCQTAATEVLDGDPGNVAEDLQTSSYTRTALYYHDDDTEYLDCAALARGLARDLDAPRGQGTWAGDTLAGVPTSSITAAQRATLHGYSVNTYEERRAGRKIVREGTVSSGEYIDTMTGLSWLEVRLLEDLDVAMHGNPDGLLMSQEGIDALALAIRARLRISQQNNVLAPGWTVSAPRYEDLSASDISNRHVRTFEWDATIQHFIHKVSVKGRINI
ncbi:MAG: DUF3383 domain-containing protein [Myxococcales bacterium FL481]|nr:MAG: DUF3383 domain-containing protein [Myxococcales bacterium FL481]